MTLGSKEKECHHAEETEKRNMTQLDQSINNQSLILPPCNMQHTPWLRWSWDETLPASQGPKKVSPYRARLLDSPWIISTHSSPVRTCSPKSSGRLSQARPQSLAPHGFGVLLRSIRRFLAPTHPRIDYPIPAQSQHRRSVSYRIRVGGPKCPLVRNRKRDQLAIFFASFLNSVNAGTCG